MAARQLKQSFGAVVRQHRLRKDMSQEELAFEAGLTRNYISIVELGQQSPTLDTIEAIAQALGTTASNLIARAEREV
jgi:transcriptional regulator with XRE-family HTH domain